jgi:hypothetical protein
MDLIQSVGCVSTLDNRDGNTRDQPLFSSFEGIEGRSPQLL